MWLNNDLVEHTICGGYVELELWMRLHILIEKYIMRL